MGAGCTANPRSEPTGAALSEAHAALLIDVQRNDNVPILVPPYKVPDAQTSLQSSLSRLLLLVLYFPSVHFPHDAGSCDPCSLLGIRGAGFCWFFSNTDADTETRRAIEPFRCMVARQSEYQRVAERVQSRARARQHGLRGAVNQAARCGVTYNQLARGGLSRTGAMRLTKPPSSSRAVSVHVSAPRHAARQSAPSPATALSSPTPR